MDEEEAQELVDSLWGKEGTSFIIDGKPYRYVKEMPNMVDHRWASTTWYIFAQLPEGDSSDSNLLWAFPYDVGSTEMQESGWEYCQPKLFPVEEVQVTSYIALE